MEFTELVSYLQSKIKEYYNNAEEFPKVEYEIDNLNILINIRLYMVRPTDLEYFNSLVGKEYDYITFEVHYPDDYGPCLVVVYKF